MKCPICGKELELRNKQIGTNENGDPIFNEYAISGILINSAQNVPLQRKRHRKRPLKRKRLPKKMPLPVKYL